MKKWLFFDNAFYEIIDNFERRAQKAKKHRKNPLMLPDQPWENGVITLYGSVARAPGGPYQLWYTVLQGEADLRLAYAESDDGLNWRKPAFDFCRHMGRKTNILLPESIHGLVVLYDPDDPDPDLRYKMLGGYGPEQCICSFGSPDGIRWERVRKRFAAIPTNPDCPMGLVRRPDGRYAAYHRLLPVSGRRVYRSESWDFKYWSGEPRRVLEPNPLDPPGTQIYGMGSAMYGPYEIGSVWIYTTDTEDVSKIKGVQEPELTFSRTGTCWHRAAQGTPLVPRGRKGQWDYGNLQCASQPLFLDDEVRYYYAATNIFHSSWWELKPQKMGLGMASIKPDRWIARAAGTKTGMIRTRVFRPDTLDFRVNARVRKGGWVELALVDLKGRTYASRRLEGDSLAHEVVWKSPKRMERLVGENVRMVLKARQAEVYAIVMREREGESMDYRSWREP